MTGELADTPQADLGFSVAADTARTSAEEHAYEVRRRRGGEEPGLPGEYACRRRGSVAAAAAAAAADAGMGRVGELAREKARRPRGERESASPIDKRGGGWALLGLGFNGP